MCRRGGMCKKACRGGSDVGALAVVVVLGVLAVVVYVAYAVLRGVFSWHGFLYSVGLAPGAGLSFAPAVRVVTLLGLLELAVAVAMALDYLEGRRFLELRWAWAMAPGPLAIPLCRGAGWGGVRGATPGCEPWHRRPAH